MKKISFIIISFISLASWILADNYLFTHKASGVSSNSVASIDSITFSQDHNYIALNKSGGSVVRDTLYKIDSLTFADITSKIISIVYSGITVNVTNPYQGHGVNIEVNGADVVVKSTLTDTELSYQLSGTTSDGSFKMYSNYKYDLVLNTVSITNNDGPAINIQSGKKCTLILAEGSNNTLIDGSSYAKSTEDQKGTLFSEGQIVFQGTGTLNVTGNNKHAICSDDYISVTNGVINVISAASDAIHSNDYYSQSGGKVTLNSSGDGIDTDGYISITNGNLKITSTVNDVKGIKAGKNIDVTGGSIEMTVAGAQSKGVKAAGIITLSGGTINISTSGNVVLAASGSGYDPSYCTAIKGDSIININGASIVITGTGSGSKGISSDRDINILSGSVTITNSGSGTTYTNASGTKDSYNATCLTSDVNITIKNGTVTCSASGAGGKAIKADEAITIGDSSNSPTITLTTSGSKFAVSSTGSTGGGPGGGSSNIDYCHPKALLSDGDITINNGNLTISSTDDAIHAEKSITINGGNTNITKSVEGIEAFIINMNGGYVNIIASDDGVNSTAGTTAGGTESNDGSKFNMNGGVMITSATSGDAIDVNGDFKMTGGVLVAFGPANSTNEDIDANGSIVINGGTFFGACYNSNMFEIINSSSTQTGVNLKGSSSVASAGSYFRIQDASGNDLGTFITPRAAYYFHFSSPSLKKSSSYSVYTGGSYTGGTTYGDKTNGGYSTGGTYSGGSLKKTFTTGSSTITTVSSW